MPKPTQRRKKEYLIDKIILVVAVLEPLCTLPQIIEIYDSKDASGVSILTWVGLNILTTVWIWYAIIRKQKVVLIYQTLFFIFDTILIIGAIIYGGQWL